MMQPTDSEHVMAVRITQAICAAVVLIAALVVTCQVKKPEPAPPPPVVEVRKKTGSEQCIDLCASRRVKRFVDSQPFVCDCEESVVISR